MSTADVARAACELSNLRTRLNEAASTATRRVFLGLTPQPGTVIAALHDLIEEVDAVYDALQPFAFYTDSGTERLLALSTAMAYAHGGDAESAGRALVAMFHSEREVA